MKSEDVLCKTAMRTGNAAPSDIKVCDMTKSKIMIKDGCFPFSISKFNEINKSFRLIKWSPSKCAVPLITP